MMPRPSASGGYRLGTRHWTRWRAALGAAIAIGASGALADAASALEPAASRARQLDRVQLHRNGLRGQAYVSRWRADGSSEPARFEFRPLRSFPLPGDPLENVHANLHPIDADGDGDFEFIHANGSRFARAFRQDGSLLWADRNPEGRTHRTFAHRDSAAVLDADGDGRQEFVHCWVYPGTNMKRLVVRRGDTGEPVANRALTGDPARSECHVAAFRVEGRPDPIILVSRQLDLPGSTCPRRFTDLWTVTAAFDTELRPLWQRETCDAGHFVWPLDEDADGRAEAVFVGKYLIRPDGTLRCAFPNWADDHVDGLTVADLDPARPGLEVAAAGNSGARLLDAGSCDLLTSIPTSRIRNPQATQAAVLSATAAAPSLFVGVKHVPGVPQMNYRVSPRGEILGRWEDTNPRERVRITNANLDGAMAAEDVVTWYGQVIDPDDGRLRLSADWYWGLQDLTPAERDLPPRDQWTIAPLVVDLDGDGRDEIVTWGRRRLVVGSLRGDGDDDDGDGGDDDGGGGGDGDGSGGDGAGGGDRGSFDERAGGRRAAHNDHGQRRSRFNERGRPQRETEAGTGGGTGTEAEAGTEVE